MPEIATVIRLSLESAGVASHRIDSVMTGSPLFGSAGVLDSLELVGFITSLSQISGVDVFDLMDGLDLSSDNIFESADKLSTFLSNRAHARPHEGL